MGLPQQTVFQQSDGSLQSMGAPLPLGSGHPMPLPRGPRTDHAEVPDRGKHRRGGHRHPGKRQSCPGGHGESPKCWPTLSQTSVTTMENGVPHHCRRGLDLHTTGNCPKDHRQSRDGIRKGRGLHTGTELPPARQAQARAQGSAPSQSAVAFRPIGHKSDELDVAPQPSQPPRFREQRRPSAPWSKHRSPAQPPVHPAPHCGERPLADDLLVRGGRWMQKQQLTRLLREMRVLRVLQAVQPMRRRPSMPST